MAETSAVLAQRLLELRQSIDALRAAAGLSAATWTDAVVTGQVTVIQAVHVLELRARLDEALTGLGCAPTAYTDPDLTVGDTPVKAVHLQEVRANTSVEPAGPCIPARDIVAMRRLCQRGAREHR